MQIFRFLLIAVFLLQTAQIYPQKINSDIPNKNIRKKLNAGHYFFQTNQYLDAIKEYTDVYTFYKDDALVNFRLGKSYLETDLQPSKALAYLEKAIFLDSDVDKRLNFYFARALQLNYRFEEAITIFEMLPDRDEGLIAKRIEECRSGIELMNQKDSAEITSVAENINTRHPEYRPVITGRSNILLFTSRNDDNKGRIKDPGDHLYYEDAYISTRKKGVWHKPTQIDNQLTTDGHDAILDVSADGKKVLFFNGKTRMGDLFISEKDGNRWSAPDRLPDGINSKFPETSASFSPTGDTIYFISKRKGTIGGKDVYFSFRTGKGKWSEGINLGATINSIYDEEAVHLDPMGTNLYFSSKGHNSMGGFDVFVSKRDSTGNWIKPKNMGHPVNTPADDLFFVITDNGYTGYYASNRQETKGNFDIFRIKFGQAKAKQLKTDALEVEEEEMEEEATIAVDSTDIIVPEIKTMDEVFSEIEIEIVGSDDDSEEIDISLEGEDRFVLPVESDDDEVIIELAPEATENDSIQIIIEDVQ